MVLTYTPKRLAQAAPAGTAETTIYTVPGAQLAIVKQIMVANVLPGSITVTVSIVPVGGTAGAGNRIAPSVAIPGKSVLTFDLSEVMATGDFISVSSSAGGAATFTVSGVETTVAELPAAGLQIALGDLPIGTRPRLNFHNSQFVSMAVTDDVAGGEVDVTVNVLPQAYTHTQGVPANPWVINHNLGFYPNATVLDSANSVVEGDITYPSPNQMQILFSGAFSGVAYLS